jgi:predicted RNase H-like nuclease (RuvC/YqgF family)
MVGRVVSASEKVSQAQIDALGERMDKGFTELKDMLSRFDERLREQEKQTASCQPLMNSKLDAAWRRIDSHDAQLEKLQKALQDMAKTAEFLETVARWLLGIITAVIIAIVIAFLTGKIDIVIR